MRFFIGTYTKDTGSAGIYTLDFDTNTESFSVIASTVSDNPSFLAMQDGYIYAANEIPETGRIESYKINPDGSLSLINFAEFPGCVSCHLTVHPLGNAVYAANYGSGNIAAFTLNLDGSIGRRLSLIQHEGSGPNKGRQQHAHAHSVNISPDGARLIAADLGIDRLMIYGIDPEDGSLSTNEPYPFAGVTPGEGPRHLTYHPEMKVIYTVTELKNSILVFDYNSDSGSLKQKQSISVLPDIFKGSSTAADIHLSPDNRFLYASSRGYDGIVSCMVGSDGSLSEAKHYEGFGKTPRNFAVSSDGEYFIIAYQNSDSIVAVKRDKVTGGMKELAADISIPAPVCILQYK